MSGKLDFSRLDIVAEVERHTSTRLRPASPSGKQWIGACPFDDCSGDDDGFMVWPELTSRNCHYYCRTCRRAGNVADLVSKVKEISYREACVLLELTASDTPLPKRQAPVNDRQAQERAILTDLYPLMQRALRHPRSQAYLVQRGIPFDLAVSLGLGYLPPFASIPADEITPNLKKIQRWCDRLIFPLKSKQGQGFTGRTLYLWESGLDENEHKRRLDDYNKRMVEEHGEREGVWRQMPRWKTTNPAGYFHTEILAECEQVTFVEGPFDACALVAGGIADVIATCGTSIDIGFIPDRICDAVLAYDGDASGKKAAADWYKALNRRGIATRRCTPPDDELGKDWSERYRLHGQTGLAALFIEDRTPNTEQQKKPNTEHQDALVSDTSINGLPSEVSDDAIKPSPVCAICGAGVERYCYAGIAYCGQHWPYSAGDGQEPVRCGWDLCCTCGAPAEHASPGGDTYCSACYRCVRGHIPRWRQREDGRWLCSCYWEQAVSERQPEPIRVVDDLWETILV